VILHDLIKCDDSILIVNQQEEIDPLEKQQNIVTVNTKKYHESQYNLFYKYDILVHIYI